MSDHEDEINEIMGQASAEMFGEQMMEMVRQLGLLDAQSVVASRDGDQEALQNAGMQIATTIANTPWGILPSVLMAAVRQVNIERSERMDEAQKVHDQTKALNEVLAMLARVDAVPAQQLRDLMDVRDALQTMVHDGPYAQTVDP